MAARNAGFVGASNSDAGDLNYGKGDRYSTLFKLLTDVSMTQGSMGFKLGAKIWSDEGLKRASVPFGNQANGFNAATSAPSPMPANAAATLTTLGSPAPLSDQGFAALNKFSGAGEPSVVSVAAALAGMGDGAEVAACLLYTSDAADE